MKLSELVREYLRKGQVEYAVLLTLAAKSVLDWNKIRKVAQMFRRDVRGLVSWIYYHVRKGLLKREGKGKYRLSENNIQVDLEECIRLLEQHNVKLDSLDTKFVIVQESDVELIKKLVESDLKDKLKRLLDRDSRLLKVTLQVLEATNKIAILICNRDSEIVRIEPIRDLDLDTLLKLVNLLGRELKVRDREYVLCGFAYLSLK